MGYRVLVVDDSPIIRSVVRKALTMAGLPLDEVHDAANGAEALRVLGERWIDVVFADLNMPEMDGVELVQRMAADELLRAIPVVVITSDPNRHKHDRLIELGVRGYLKKPFRPEEFRALVLGVLGVGPETGEQEASRD